MSNNIDDDDDDDDDDNNNNNNNNNNIKQTTTTQNPGNKLPPNDEKSTFRQVWDVASGQCVHTLRGHNDEILDVSFNATGSRLVTASADGTSRVFNTMNGACQAILIGHEGEISKVGRRCC